MITTFIMKLVLSVVSALVSMLPTWTLDTTSVTSTSSGFGTFLGAFNNYLPEHLIVTCLALLVAVKLFMFGWNAVTFLYRLIPGKLT